MTIESAESARIAIVGFAESHLHEAPFGQPGWQFWGINRLHTVAAEQPWTHWFNIHDLEKFHGQDQEHLAFLKQFPGPVYLRPQDLGKYDIPNQTPFPADELVKKYGRYFNNTISWLIAFAIEHNPSDIGVFGVDMAQDALLNAEYASQRPSCEYFLGIAMGLGISVHLPNASDLLKATHLYGFEDADQYTLKLVARLNELGNRKEKAKAELAGMDMNRGQLTNAINQLDGAMQDVQFWLRNWRPMDLGLPFQTVESEDDASTNPDD